MTPAPSDSAGARLLAVPLASAVQPSSITDDDAARVRALAVNPGVAGELDRSGRSTLLRVGVLRN